MIRTHVDNFIATVPMSVDFVMKCSSGDVRVGGDAIINCDISAGRAVTSSSFFMAEVYKV